MLCIGVERKLGEKKTVLLYKKKMQVWSKLNSFVCLRRKRCFGEGGRELKPCKPDKHFGVKE